MLMLGDPTKALTWFDRALGIDANHIESLHGKGIALLNLGDPDVANEWFDQVLAIQPTHPGTSNSVIQSKGLLIHSYVQMHYMPRVLRNSCWEH